MTPERLLIIGNGMASVRLVETLARLGPGRFAITVVGAEPRPGYNRVLLSALLAGEIGEVDIELRGRDWYARHGVELVTGERVVSVDVGRRAATLASGRAVAFDACVFATGSEPIRLPVPGMDLPGVVAFRDMEDLARMKAAAHGGKIAVIGGGLLGIEAAHGLARLGADVTLVHVMDRLMERQLDAAAAKLLRRLIERKGVKVLLESQTVSVTGEERARGLVFADGSRLDADLVVCAVGVRPQAALAKAAGLAVGRGVVVDDGLAASAPGFFAVGECAEHRGVAYGLVEPCHAQAETLAKRLMGLDAAFRGMTPATNLKVSGVAVFSAGDFAGGEGATSAAIEDKTAGVYRKLVFKGGRLAGCVLVGNADDGLWYLDLMRRGVDISAARRDLIHGRAFAETSLREAA